MVKIFLLVFVIAASLLQSSSNSPPLHGQVIGDYLSGNDTTFFIVGNDAPIPENLQSHFGYDGQSLLVKKSSTDTTLEFVIVYKNVLNPIVEWCRPASCKDKFTLCFDKECSDDSSFSFSYGSKPLYFFGIARDTISEGCVQVRPNDGGSIDLIPHTGVTKTYLAPFQTGDRPLPQNDTLMQAYVRMNGSTCGNSVKFPNASLLFTELDETSSTSSSVQTSPNTNASDEASNGTTAAIATTTELASGMSWQEIVAICGSIFGVIVILAVLGLVLYCCRRKNTNKKKKAKAGAKKIVKPGPSKSMESVAAPFPPSTSTAVPAPTSTVPATPSKPTVPAPTTKTTVPSTPAKPATPAPSKTTVPAAASKPTVPDVPTKTTVPAADVSPKIKTDVTQPSASVATACDKISQPGVLKLERFPDDPIKTAEEKTKEPADEEFSLMQTACPPIRVDKEAAFTKLVALDFYWKLTCPPKKTAKPNIIPFLTQKLFDPAYIPSQYTADYLLQHALFQPDNKDRTKGLLNAVIQANNQLYDLGFRRKTSRTAPNVKDQYYVTCSKKADQWLKKLSDADFLHFIVKCCEKRIDGKDGEYEDNEDLWKGYLYKSDVPETFRQACLYGQSFKRREFFMLATFYKLGELIKMMPDPKVLLRMGYPIPLLLDILYEHPQRFMVKYDDDWMKPE